MQVIAAGKWSKPDRSWKMVVALRRPAESDSVQETKAASRPATGRRSSVARLSDWRGK